MCRLFISTVPLHTGSAPEAVGGAKEKLKHCIKSDIKEVK